MGSVIDLKVVSGDGDELSEMRFTVDYGDEEQTVVVVLDNPDGIETSDSQHAFRSVNDMLVEHGIIDCQSDRDNA